MANPNPARIDDALWRMWTSRPGSGWRYGGTYANKSGYHNTVEANLVNWPGNYSVRYSLDLRRGPRDKARGIDYTMSDSQMKTYTRRLLDACNRNDPRMKGLREFYGTLDGNRVVGRIRNDDSSAYRSSSSDSSHLWHIHISVWAAYCNNWTVLSGIMSVLSGESLSEWQARMEGGIMLPQKGDSGPVVEYWQRVLLKVGEELPQFGADADFGDETQKAINSFRDKHGANPTNRVTAWTALKLHEEAFKGERGPRGLKGEDGKDGQDGQDGVDGKTPTKVAITGDVIEAV